MSTTENDKTEIEHGRRLLVLHAMATSKSNYRSIIDQSTTRKSTACKRMSEIEDVCRDALRCLLREALSFDNASYACGCIYRIAVEATDILNRLEETESGKLPSLIKYEEKWPLLLSPSRKDSQEIFDILFKEKGFGTESIIKENRKRGRGLGRAKKEDRQLLIRIIKDIQNRKYKVLAGFFECCEGKKHKTEKEKHRYMKCEISKYMESLNKFDWQCFKLPDPNKEFGAWTDFVIAYLERKIVNGHVEDSHIKNFIRHADGELIINGDRKKEIRDSIRNLLTIRKL